VHLKLKRWRASAPQRIGLLTSSPVAKDIGYPELCPDRASLRGRQVPRAPLPGAGVTSAGAASSVASRKVTPSSSLRRAHAPVRAPHTAFSLGLDSGSLQVAASPCWNAHLPDVISANLSLVAWIHVTAVCRVHLPISSPTSSAFPPKGWVGYPLVPAQRLQSRGCFRDCNHSFMFRPPGWLCHPGRSHRRGRGHVAAVTLASEQNTRCHLRVHRTR
jgi:hypothetical protein